MRIALALAVVGLAACATALEDRIVTKHLRGPHHTQVVWSFACGNTDIRAIYNQVANDDASVGHKLSLATNGRNIPGAQSVMDQIVPRLLDDLSMLSPTVLQCPFDSSGAGLSLIARDSSARDGDHTWYLNLANGRLQLSE